MLAQVSLIPAESKKLIAKAVTKMEVFRKALKKGLIVLHPSSSTYFIIEEVTGHKPPTNCWVCGAIVPKGACGEVGPNMGSGSESFVRKEGGHSEDFLRCWILRKGELTLQEPLGALLEEMVPSDIYIKGVNALDAEGNVGVLWGSPVKEHEGGTAALVMKTKRRKGFNVIFPVGIEKLIPIRISEAAKEAKKFKYDYAMGVSCGLLPCEGTVVTELRAIEILSGASAVPIAAGGLGGAEGAITLVIKGDKKQVTKAIKYIEDSKGARLPQFRVLSCHGCMVNCKFPVKDKHWA